MILASCRFRRQNNALCATIPQNVFDVGFEQSGVNRYGDGADAHQSVVGQRPFHAVFRKNRHAVARRHVQAAQRGRQCRHLAQSMFRRDAQVAPIPLEHEAVRLRVGGHSIEEQFIEGLDLVFAHTGLRVYHFVVKFQDLLQHIE